MKFTWSVGDQTVTSFDVGSLARRANGNALHRQALTTGLNSYSAIFEIEPVFGSETEKELRIESLCVAGGEAIVIDNESDGT